MAVNCLELDEDAVAAILKAVLYEFPLRELDLFLPPWVDALPADHPIKAGLYDAIRQNTAQLRHIREVEGVIAALGESEHISEARISAIDLGTGVAAGENRAREAAQRAINSPLLEDVSLESAKAVLYNITASMDISTDEIAEIGDIIADATPEDTNIIFGVVYDENIGDELRLTVIATGIDPSATVVQPVAEPVKSSSVTKFPGSQAARPMEAPQAPAYEQPRPRPVRQREIGRAHV